LAANAKHICNQTTALVRIGSQCTIHSQPPKQQAGFSPHVELGAGTDPLNLRSEHNSPLPKKPTKQERKRVTEAQRGKKGERERERESVPPFRSTFRSSSSTSKGMRETLT